MTTGIQCRVDPRCEVPAQPGTGICPCPATQATKAVATIHRISRADQGRRVWSRLPDKELEP
jgi:hypothetical protein